MTGSLDAKVESGRARVTLSDDSGVTLNLDLDRENDARLPDELGG